MIRRLLLLAALAVLIASCSSLNRSTSVATPATAGALTTTPAETPTMVTVTAAPGAATVPAATASASAAAGADPAPSGERALAHDQKLAGEIGPRPAGSPAEQQAAQYIAGQLRADGYDVELQTFAIQQFVSRSVSFRVLAPETRTLSVGPLTFSRPGSAEGDLYVAGLGRPSDYPAGGIDGRIALVQRGELSFGDKARNAAAAGASAAVIFEPGNDVVPGLLSGDIPDIPVVSIAGADGVRLHDLAQTQPVHVALSFDGGVEDVRATNVIGRPRGKECAAVAGSHYDTVPQAPGASDNGSGTAVMLELARVQALRGNPQQACFIAFSGEELGLKGSAYYLSTLTVAQRQAIRFMLNFDMEAVGDEWEFIGSPALQQQAKAAAAGIGIDGRIAGLPGGASSDHASFIDQKIPALLLFRSDDPLLHTPQDTIDRISAQSLGDAVRMGLAFLSAFGQG